MDQEIVVAKFLSLYRSFDKDFRHITPEEAVRTARKNGLTVSLTTHDSSVIELSRTGGVVICSDTCEGHYTAHWSLVVKRHLVK